MKHQDYADRQADQTESVAGRITNTEPPVDFADNVLHTWRARQSAYRNASPTQKRFRPQLAFGVLLALLIVNLMSAYFLNKPYTTAPAPGLADVVTAYRLTSDSTTNSLFGDY